LLVVHFSLFENKCANAKLRRKSTLNYRKRNNNPELLGKEDNPKLFLWKGSMCRTFCLRPAIFCLIRKKETVL
jgi:hypothetical protein